MNIVDACILLLFLASLMVGHNLGFSKQVCISIGTFFGLLVSVSLANRVVHVVSEPTLRIAVVLLVVGLFMLLCFDASYHVGQWLHKKVDHKPKLELLDKILGTFLGGITLLAFAWLVGSLLAKAPEKAVAAQIRSSKLLTIINDSWPVQPSIISDAINLTNPFNIPRIFVGAEPEVVPTTAQSSERLLKMGEKVSPSVIKVTATGCGGEAVGTGFVIKDNMVITNAHVIAGVNTPFVQSEGKNFQAPPIWVDPKLDIALLKVRGDLHLAALPLKEPIQPRATPGVVVGYPGGTKAIGEAIVMSSFSAIGYDIYDREKTNRNIYALQAKIMPGNSGGPFVDESGSVIGVVFGHSLDKENVGYALTMKPIIKGVNDAVASGVEAVSAGRCEGA